MYLEVCWTLLQHVQLFWLAPAAAHTAVLYASQACASDDRYEASGYLASMSTANTVWLAVCV